MNRAYISLEVHTYTSSGVEWIYSAGRKEPHCSLIHQSFVFNPAGRKKLAVAV